MPTPHDTPLDTEHDKPTSKHLITAKLERRLAYWLQQQEQEILKRYRAITSI